MRLKASFRKFTLKLQQLNVLWRLGFQSIFVFRPSELSRDLPHRASGSLRTQCNGMYHTKERGREKPVPRMCNLSKQRSWHTSATTLRTQISFLASRLFVFVHLSSFFITSYSALFPPLPPPYPYATSPRPCFSFPPLAILLDCTRCAMVYPLTYPLPPPFS